MVGVHRIFCVCWASGVHGFYCLVCIKLIGYLPDTDFLMWLRLVLWPSSIGYLGTAGIENWSAASWTITLTLCTINVVMYGLFGLAIYLCLRLLSRLRRS